MRNMKLVDSKKEKMIIKIKLRYIIYGILPLFVAILIYVYDQYVLWHVPLYFRLIFNVGIFFFIYLPAQAMIKQVFTSIDRERLCIMRIKESSLKVIPLINIVFLINIICLNIPSIGSLSSNVFIQGIRALPYFFLYLFASIINGFMLLVSFVGASSINVYDILIFSVIFMSLESLFSIYGFYLAGTIGIRIILIFILIFLSLAYIYRISKMGIQSIVIEDDSRQLPYVILLSLTTFFFYYFFALYTHFWDQAVMFSNVNSIIYRESLEPYFRTTDYYTAIGGFHVASFIYMVGLNNTMLASTLAFMIAYMFIPLITYRLMKILSGNEFMAFLATVMMIHVDGLLMV